MSFVHLHVHSNFSFKTSTLSTDAIIEAARGFGMPAVAITDHMSLSGAIRFFNTARTAGVQPIIGAEIHTAQGHLTVLASGKAGYGDLCHLLSRAHLDGNGLCTAQQIAEHQNLIVLFGCRKSQLAAALAQDKAGPVTEYFKELFGDRYYIELLNHRLPETALNIHRLVRLATRYGVSYVATNNIHMLSPRDFLLRDILSAAGKNVKVTGNREDKLPNSECYFKSAKEMTRLFAEYPDAIANTLAIAERCKTELPEGFKFPRFKVPDGYTARSFLERLTQDSVSRLYPVAERPAALQRLDYEIRVIDSMGFSDYFLAVWDIVQFARQSGIRGAGRGSAADSIVSFLLGITHVDPIKYKLLFERFLNPERRGMPDIDIDFDSNRRDEVINYVYAKYGRDMVAMVCTVNTMNARSAVRDVAKAMGMTSAQQSAISKRLPHYGADRINMAIDTLPELKGEFRERQYFQTIFRYAEKLAEFPRHLGVHNGGVIIADQPISRLTPLQYATKGIVISQHDKDDVEKLGLVKMDLLGLKMLSIIEDTVNMLRQRGIKLDIDRVADDDAATYQMLRSTQTVGTFQLESPGMRELLGRLQPTRFEDIIANISLFRPGPMQGDMIAPFIARRHGKEPVDYFHPLLEPVLKDTFGVVIYQEQVLEIANRLAGFTLGQGDLLRRAMTKNRTPAEMSAIREQFIGGCRLKGVDYPVAELVFSKLAGFAAYGFNKAHAASFGWISYQSAYLKTHYPCEFFCATLNNYPCGFYPPIVTAWEAKRLGIELRLPDLVAGNWDCIVQNGAIVIGGKYLPGQSHRDWIRSVDDYGDSDNKLFPEEVESMGIPEEEIQALAAGFMTHPLGAFSVRYTPSSEAEKLPHGAEVVVAGVVIIRQTPPTRSGKRIIFLTLHDETGLSDVTIFPDIQQQYAKVVYQGNFLKVTGTIRKTGVYSFSVIARKVEKLA